MERLREKADFLRHQFTAALKGLDVNASGKWGKMNVQQMIEHMSNAVRIANGRIAIKMITPEDKLARMQAFVESEKPFQENTPNALLSDTPLPVKHATKQEAIDELQAELDHFFAVHDNEPGRKTINPFFGDLSYEQQVQLLHKHATHHLRQFSMDY